MATVAAVVCEMRDSNRQARKAARNLVAKNRSKPLPKCESLTVNVADV